MEKMWIFGGVVALFVIVLVIGAIASKRRRQALEAVAQRLGLDFAPDAGDVHLHYDENFLPFGRGRSRRTKNLLHGRRGNVEWEVFDYRFRTGSGKNARTHHYGIAAATVPIRFRRLVLRPEGFFDKVAQLAGFDDINFESEAFSRRYHVSCEVRKHAYDVLHPQMIEYLLSAPPRHWQFAGNVILIHKSGDFDADELEAIVAMVEGCVQRVPAYVRDDAALFAPREA